MNRELAEIVYILDPISAYRQFGLRRLPDNGPIVDRFKVDRRLHKLYRKACRYVIAGYSAPTVKSRHPRDLDARARLVVKQITAQRNRLMVKLYYTIR